MESPRNPLLSDGFRDLAMDMAMQGRNEEEILAAIVTRGGDAKEWREMVQQILLQTGAAREICRHPKNGLDAAKVFGIITIVVGLLAIFIGVRAYGAIALICGVLLVSGVSPHEEV